MNERINIGVVGIGKMRILHVGILSSLDGAEVKMVGDKQGLILSFIKGVLLSIGTYEKYKNRDEVNLT